MKHDEDELMVDTELLYANKYTEQKRPHLEAKWKYINLIRFNYNQN